MKYEGGGDGSKGGREGDAEGGKGGLRHQVLRRQVSATQYSALGNAMALALALALAVDWHWHWRLH